MSIQNYSYKYKLVPTKLQEILLSKHTGANRKVYNLFLKERNEFYRKHKDDPIFEEYTTKTGQVKIREKKGLDYYDNANKLTKLKLEEQYWYFKETNSQCLQSTLKDLDSAFNRFFKGLADHPVFHSKARKQSFRVPQSVKIEGSKLYIPKFLEGIEFVNHRELEGKICFATISKEPSGEYFVSFTVEKEIQELSKTGKSVGIDIGIKDTFVTSDGVKTGNPKVIKKHWKKVKFFQRKFSKLIKLSVKKPCLNENGSQRYTSKGRPKFYAVQSKRCVKASIRKAKYHKKITDRKKDHIHKATTHLVRNYDTICIEDLNVAGMMKNHCLAKSIADTAFSEVKRQLEYKCRYYGKSISKIGRFFASSKTCSNCSYTNHKLELKDRDWTCISCGISHDRDRNAAQNILLEGLRISMLAGTQA